MSFRPFVHLPSIQYLSNDGPDIGAGPYSSVTPACMRAEEIDASLAVLFEIAQAHKQDVEENQDWLPERDSTNVDAIVHLRHVGMRLPRFKAREVWRIGSYVMFWCSLEDVVEHEYQALLSLLERLAPDIRARLQVESSADLESRSDEVEPIREYRNKVFAHTAYAKPLKVDDSSTQLTSLVHFTGSDYLLSKRGLTLGGTTVIPDEYGLAPHFLSGPQRFKEISVSILVERAVPHFLAWWSMYKTVLTPLYEMPETEVRAAWPAVVRRIRRPDLGVPAPEVGPQEDLASPG